MMITDVSSLTHRRTLMANAGADDDTDPYGDIAPLPAKYLVPFWLAALFCPWLVIAALI